MPDQPQQREERDITWGETQPRRPSCPVCGGVLIEIRHKRQCAQCHTICETCCEGGRG